jgi:cytochrome c oxidase assembly protein Cox11
LRTSKKLSVGELIGAKLVYIFLVICVIFVINSCSNGYSLPPFYLLFCRFDGMKNMKKVGEKCTKRGQKIEEL